MFEYELHQIRSAELIREARNHRLVREALRLRRDARKAAAGEPDTEGQSTSHSSRPRRPRFARAA